MQTTWCCWCAVFSKACNVCGWLTHHNNWKISSSIHVIKHTAELTQGFSYYMKCHDRDHSILKWWDLSDTRIILSKKVGIFNLFCKVLCIQRDCVHFVFVETHNKVKTIVKKHNKLYLLGILKMLKKFHNF